MRVWELCSEAGDKMTTKEIVESLGLYEIYPAKLIKNIYLQPTADLMLSLFREKAQPYMMKTEKNT